MFYSITSTDAKAVKYIVVKGNRHNSVDKAHSLELVYRDSYQSKSTIIPPTKIVPQSKPGTPCVCSGCLLYCPGNFLAIYTTEKPGKQPQLYSF